MDKALPLGLRSAPHIFTAFADALQWIKEKRGVKNVYHYLDDFISVGSPGSLQCQKVSTAIVFLGMELDTQALEIHLPDEKLARLRVMLADWENRRAGK